MIDKKDDKMPPKKEDETLSRKITMWTILIPCIAGSLGLGGGSLLNDNTKKLNELETTIRVHQYQLDKIESYMIENKTEHAQILKMLNEIYYKNSKMAMKE